MADPYIHILNQVAPRPLHEAAWQACMSKNWYFGNNSNTGGPNVIPFWKMDLDGVETSDELWRCAKPICEQKLGQTLRIIRQYANGHTYGQGGQVHQDDTREGACTLLYYPMPTWKHDWDGETMYFNAKGEVIAAIRPMPNRAVLFDSRIPHLGRAPSRFFSGLRVTIAFKLEAA